MEPANRKAQTTLSKASILSCCFLAACGSSATLTNSGSVATATPKPGSHGGSVIPVAGTPTIKMGTDAFIGNANIMIKAGNRMQFDNSDPNGSQHDLVTSTNDMYVEQDGAADAFNSPSGFDFNPGDGLASFMFVMPSMFTLTDTLHPMMLATIIVQ